MQLRPEQETLNGALDHARRTWPDRPFLRIDGKVITFAQFDEEVASLAAGLRQAGLEPGDRLLVLMRNSLECVHTWFAADRLGATWAPVNVEFRGLTLRHLCELVEPKLFVADAELVESLIDVVDPEAISGRLFVHGSAPGSFDSLATLYAAAAADAVEATRRDQSALLFTSGTTGRSKACMLSHGYFTEQAWILARDFRLRQDDVLYCPFPLFHADATALTTVPALLLGATAALSKRFSASRFWDEVREHEATVFDFMGATLTILYKAEPTPGDADNPARLAWGVPVPEWAEDFERRFGLQIVELYGSVEASLPVTQPIDLPRVPGSCGRATEGFQVAILGEDGEPVPVGETGEIAVRPSRPATILDGYFGMPEATIAAFRDLWFHSGDLGRLDAEGNLFFVGRLKDAIRRRGENISAFEVEEGILLHPEVVECAVVGVQSELSEQDVKACVVPRPEADLSPETLIGHCERHLAKFQVPRYIEFVGELPKTPTGKVEKRGLEEAGVTASTWDRQAAAA